MKTGMNKSFVWILMVSLSLASCGHRQDDRYAVDLQETPERVCYPLSVNTTLYIKSLSVFTDETGREHLVFMSNNEPELYIYGLKSRSLEKTVRYHREGADGVGPKAGGTEFGLSFRYSRGNGKPADACGACKRGDGRSAARDADGI